MPLCTTTTKVFDIGSMQSWQSNQYSFYISSEQPSSHFLILVSFMSYKRSNHCMITISFRPTKPFYILPATTSEHFQHVQISLIVPHFAYIVASSLLNYFSSKRWAKTTQDLLRYKQCLNLIIIFIYLVFEIFLFLFRITSKSKKQKGEDCSRSPFPCLLLEFLQARMREQLGSIFGCSS